MLEVALYLNLITNTGPYKVNVRCLVRVHNLCFWNFSPQMKRLNLKQARFARTWGGGATTQWYTAWAQPLWLL